MTHRFPQQKMPEPEPGSAQAREREQAADISRRPALPDHPGPTASGDEDDAERADASTHLDRTKPPGKQRG